MEPRRLALLLALLPALAGTVAVPARAEWIVFVGGGIREIRGSLDVRGRQVRFHDVSGTLMSVAADDVDVAASAFLTAQVGRMPAPSSVVAPGPAAGGRPGAACASVRLARIASAETYEVEIGGKVETIHLACVDAPETRHRIPDLAFFGHEAAARVEQLLATSPSLCLVEDDPPRRDGADHRVAFLRTGDGRDLGAEIVRRGFAVARAGNCGRVEDYLALEARARADQQGHWGPSAHGAAVAVVASTVSFGGMPTARRGGGRS
jgi:endonuclease YncB( thermonuclease family)